MGRGEPPERTDRVATLRVPTTLQREPLRVAIFGDGVDTGAYVRNFAWWTEPWHL